MDCLSVFSGLSGLENKCVKQHKNCVEQKKKLTLYNNITLLYPLLLQGVISAWILVSLFQTWLNTWRGLITRTCCLLALTLWIRFANRLHSQQTQDIEPMLDQCWADVVDDGPALNQHCFNVSCLLGSLAGCLYKVFGSWLGSVAGCTANFPTFQELQVLQLYLYRCVCSHVLSMA